MTILALNLKTVVNPKSHQNEITLVSGLVHQVIKRKLSCLVQFRQAVIFLYCGMHVGKLGLNEQDLVRA